MPHFNEQYQQSHYTAPTPLAVEATHNLQAAPTA